MKEIPHEFDWVTARAQCSIKQMFDQLQREAELDVRRRNEHNSHGPSFTFRPQPGEIIVLKGDSGTRVMFRLTENYISVQNRERNELFRITVTVNDEGRCLFKVGDKEMERWQVMRKALESLFFE